jgi:Domain of Unknown Function (DUF928)
LTPTNKTLKSLLLASATSIIIFSDLVIYPEVVLSTPTAQTSSWQDFFGIFKIKRRRGGSRGIKSSICAIAPGIPNESTQIWSDRPVFLWFVKRGNLQEIGLRIKDSETNLWSQKIKPGQEFAPYTGKTLQPGQTYEWVEVLSKAEQPKILAEFQVMEGQERENITADLKKLEAQQKNPQDLALVRAKYFLEKELLSDFVQQVYSLQKPSPELANLLKELPSSELCKQRASSANP